METVRFVFSPDSGLAKYRTEPADAKSAQGEYVRADIARGLMAALEPFAHIGECGELREAMAACLKPHERDDFLAALQAARNTLARAAARP